MGASILFGMTGNMLKNERERKGNQYRMSCPASYNEDKTRVESHKPCKMHEPESLHPKGERVGTLTHQCLLVIG